MAYEARIQLAKEHFGQVLEEQLKRGLVLTIRDTGATSIAYGESLMQTVEGPDLEENWDRYVKAS